MNKSRLIMVLAVLFTTVYMSIFGGTISYMMFFGSIAVLMLAVIYLAYVYSSFKIYQKIDTKMLVKGEEVPYHFSLANEGKIACTSIKVHFMTKRQKVNRLSTEEEYCLLPKESVDISTVICANFRGVYEVGIDTVTIKDYFGLFSYSYESGSKIRVNVYPRIIALDTLAFEEEEEDNKTTDYAVTQIQEVPDNESRLYINGDEKRRIHWKLSAAKGELYVRKYIKQPQVKRFLVIDLRMNGGRSFSVQGKLTQEQELARMEREDAIIESAVAIVNYYIFHHIGVTILYAMDRTETMEVDSASDFDAFYHMCSKVEFKGRTPIGELLGEIPSYFGQVLNYIVITADASSECILWCLRQQEQGNRVNLVLAGAEKDEKITQAEHQIPIFKVAGNEEIRSSLSKRGW